MSKHRDKRLRILAFIALPLLTCQFAAAQIHGIPPSVTSLQYHTPPFLPNAAPSVTSLGPFGYGNGQFPPVFWPFPRPYGNGFGHGHGSGYGRGNGYGYKNDYGNSNGAAIVPIYIPAYDASYGYDPDGGGAPYMYSGPPDGQTPHVVADLPTPRRDVADNDESALPPASIKSNRDVNPADSTPIDATVLVFRDGHRQEITNYAIVGQTVYVFDKRTQKIAITDLDVAATIKLNDDRGVDFHVPPDTKS